MYPLRSCLPWLGLLFTFFPPQCLHALVVPTLPPPVVHTAIGGVAGGLGALAAYPIDYVKSQLQTKDGRQQYKNGVDAAIKIVTNSPVGPLALYRGSLVNVAGILPEKAIKLGVNEFLRGAIATSLGGSLPIAGEVIAGGCAGLCQVIATNPLEVIKVRLQTSDLSLREVMRGIDGPLGLYQGAGACILRDVVFSAMLFPLYAHAKVFVPAVLAAAGGGVEPSLFWSGIIAGSMAAAPSAFLATPADVIKTRLQQSPSAHGDSDGLDSVMNGLASERSSVVFVLFSGWLERVIRSIPQFGVTLAMFDVLTTAAIGAGLLPP